MEIYFLRHGVAVPHGGGESADDSERTLTPEGLETIERNAKALKKTGWSFDWLISSPYARARQTAEAVAGVFKAGGKLRFSDNLVPGGDPKLLIVEARKLLPWERIVFVGHEPGLTELISKLTTGNRGLSIKLKKGGLCKLAADQLTCEKCATLEWLLTPRQIALWDA